MLTRYRLFYHIVWGTKGREPWLREPLRDLVFRAIGAKVREFRGVVHALDGTEDHVHLVVTLPPSVSIAQVVKEVKGSSSHLASQAITDPDSTFAWQLEYAVLSVSESHLPLLIRYVQDQQQHHAANKLNATLETLE